MLEDLPLRENAPRVEHEEPQQIELGRRQVEQDVCARDFVTTLVEQEISHADDVARQVARRAPEDRLHAGDDLGEAEWLGDVIVAARAERRDLVLDRLLRGEEENRRLEAAVADA